MWSENILLKYFNLLKFGGLALWPSIWSILINVPAPDEKNVCGKQNSDSHDLPLLMLMGGYVTLRDKGILQM